MLIGITVFIINFQFKICNEVIVICSTKTKLDPLGHNNYVLYATSVMWALKLARELYRMTKK